MSSPAVLKIPNTCFYALLNFGMVCGIYGFGMWLPSIITAISGDDILRVSLIALILLRLAALLVYPWSMLASKTRKIAVLPASVWLSPHWLAGAVVFFKFNVRFPIPDHCRHTLVSIPRYRVSYRCLPTSRQAQRRPRSRRGELHRQLAAGRKCPYVVGLLNDFSFTAARRD